MKTLRESILAGIDVQMANGDKWVKETKEFLKSLSTAKNYESAGFKDGRTIKLFVPNLLEQLGYDANHIEIMMCSKRMFNPDGIYWELSVWLTKPSDNYKIPTHVDYYETIHMNRDEFNKWNDILKELIKPATKSLDTFKKFLDNVKKCNGQVVDKQLLLK